MKNIFQIILLNIVLVFAIGFYQIFVEKLFDDKIIKQLLLIIFYFIIIIVIIKTLKIEFNFFNFKKNFILLVALNCSVFTVIYYIFQITDLINVIFNFSNYRNNFLYFILLPFELLLVSTLEELFFRKFMFSKMKNFSVIKIIFITSILFSFSHFPNSIIDFILLFTSAVIYGIIYYITKDIKYSLGLHFATNLSILFYGLHNDESFSGLVVTTNKINLLNNNFTTSDIIILLSELIILTYFFRKPKII